MKNASMNKVECLDEAGRSDRPKRLVKLSALVCVIGILLSGCAKETVLLESDLVPYVSAKLTEGNVIAISFPGSPNLNTAQTIRSDGKIDLSLVGEVTAAGKTPAELEKELLTRYEKELVLKQISVTVQSWAYPVYVTGSVMHPGKLMVDRSITVLDAIAEAGGFDNAKANMQNVAVLRHEGGQLKHYTLNVKRALDGKSKRLLYLRPSDIVYVPERIF